MHIKKPFWLQKKLNLSVQSEVLKIIRNYNLHTVCSEARCPNISECFARKNATFLILGDVCTRNCSFCNVKKGKPSTPDENEPIRIAGAVDLMGLSHVVITSPTRDDLPDGGAIFFKRTVEEIKKRKSSVIVELLIPDFAGNERSLETIVFSGADIVGHNIETVKRLYFLRKGADYKRSISVIRKLRELSPSLKIKSALMLGLGEEKEEVEETLIDLLDAGCRYLTLGQYLQPSLSHFPVKEYIVPSDFEYYKKKSFSIGFIYVESSPYARSSYKAGNYL